MAYNIGPTLAVRGEKEYMNSMKAIRESMRYVTAEANATASAFDKSDKSIQALTARNDGLKKALDQQKAAVQAAEDALARMREEGIDPSSQAYQRMEANLNNATAAMNQTNREIEANGKAMADMSNKWRQAADSATELGKKLKDAGKSIQDVGKSMSTYVTAPIVAAGTAALKMAVDFESAFTGVLKTVDGTDQQLADLKQGIVDMSRELPSTTTEISAVAEAAGQLGIQTDNVLGFTRVMIDLGETTNISSEAAASSLAQFANIVQMSQSDFDRLGSAVVALGNNLATTEADIVSMSMRLAGAGAQIGLSEADILGFSGALSSVGIAADAGGSAFSKLFSMIAVSVATSSELMDEFAAVAGMSSQAFAEAFQENAAGAITAFIEGLGRMDEQGRSSLVVLDEMGIKELRLRDSLLRLSGAGDLLADSIQLSNEGWTENIALTNEANLRYGTTESQLKILWNEVREVGRQFGEVMLPALRNVVDAAKPVIQSFAELTDEQKTNIVKWAAIAAAIGPVTVGLGKVVSGAGSVIGAFGKLSGAIADAGGVVALMSGPGGWVALGIAALGGLVAYLATTKDSYSSVTAEARKVNDAIADMSGSVATINEKFLDSVAATGAAADMANGYIAQLRELERQGLETNRAQDEYRDIVDRLNTLLPDLNITLDEQTGLIVGGTEALQANVDMWRKRAITLAAQEQLTELTKQQVEATIALSKAEKALESEKAALDDAYARQAEIYETLAEKTGMTREELEALTTTTQEQLLISTGYWQELQNIDVEIAKLLISVPALEEAVANGKMTYQDVETLIRQVKDATDAMADSIDDSTTAYKNAVPPVEGLTTEINNFIDAEGEAVIATEKFNDAVDSLSSVTQNAFGKMKESAAVSVQDMIENLKANQEAVDNFYDNLDALAQRFDDLGIGREFMEYLRGLPPEYSATISEMVGASDTELTELASTWEAGGQAAYDGAITQLGLLPPGAREVLQELLDDTDLSMADLIEAYNEGGEESVRELIEAHEGGVDDAKAASRLIAEAAKTEMDTLPPAFGEIGRNSASAFITALKLAEIDAGTATEKFTYEILKGAKRGLEIRSPSRKFVKIAEMTAEGFMVGMEQQSPIVMGKMQNWAAQWGDSFAGGMLALRGAAGRASAIRLPSMGGGATTSSPAQIITQPGGVNVTQHITAPNPLTPSQVARETKNALQRMVWQ